jgi:hypothetical protein
MKIKVISCENPTWWYATNIGREFEVEQSEYRQDRYSAVIGGGGIAKIDCEVVEDVVTRPSQVSPSQVGNIDSNEKGSGARYNSGKPDYSMLLLSDFAKHLRKTCTDEKCWEVLGNLGWFQKTHDVKFLFYVLDTLGFDAIEESTHVFTYGAAKYKKFNWMKGMQWSVPLACAVRHTMEIINGEEVDAESGRKHSGHILCNVFMLIHYVQYYKEGNDLPPKELFEVSYE